jgi:hypothetical protein
VPPASGFYEWTGPKGARQPHLFTAADGSPILGFAGVWDRWRDPSTGEDILSCTIIVCSASTWVEQFRGTRDTVTYSAAGIRRSWAMKRGHLSPRYTTDWQELLKIDN